MLVITTREFRANQKKYFDMAEKETVLIARKNGNPINLQVVNKDEIPSKEELKAIQRGLEDIRLGRTVEVANIDDIWSSIQ